MHSRVTQPYTYMYPLSPKLPSHPGCLDFYCLSHSVCGTITAVLQNQCENVYLKKTSHAALFTIARTWKQPRYPSTDEWIKKLWYIYTMEYYSAIKRNAFESVLMKWMNLEPIIQSEASQKEKGKYCILTHIYGI